jgi:polar amino acid transport system permease protein
VAHLLQTYFSPHHFRYSLPVVWAGLKVTVQLMLISEALVLVFALILAVIRGLPGRAAMPLRGLTVVYTDVFRGTPLLLVGLILSLGLPGLGLPVLSNLSPFQYGVAALTLVYSAYVTEVYRAGIQSVHPSQRMAARSLGLGYAQTMRHVILPQAVRRVIPPLLNDFIGLQKDTSIIYVVGAAEMILQAQNYSSSFFNLTSYVVAAMFYIYMTIPLARFTDHLIAQREKLERAQGT